MKLGGNSNGRVAASKGVPFSKNPVLAVRLPVWRSRVVLFLLFFAFAGLGARALWLQGVSTQFLQKQGKARYERTLELPATRGKITDRNLVNFLNMVILLLSKTEILNKYYNK